VLSSCCGFQDTAEQQFTGKRAAKELADYRRRRVVRTTRLLRDGLVHARLNRGALLDIGAGIGSLTFELLDRGITSAIIVEASSAYLAAGRDEAARRGRTSSIQFVHGDFLSVPRTLPITAVVTLDRVVCCYPSYEPLLAHALEHASHVFAFSYPKDRSYVRAVAWLKNVMRSRRSSFRTFVHPAAHMQQIIEAAGFDLVSRRGTLAWSADIFVRRG
jgi:magnesium-protoporphyrin O-methyltransferase